MRFRQLKLPYLNAHSLLALLLTGKVLPGKVIVTDTQNLNLIGGVLDLWLIFPRDITGYVSKNENNRSETLPGPLTATLNCVLSLIQAFPSCGLRLDRR